MFSGINLLDSSARNDVEVGGSARAITVRYDAPNASYFAPRLTKANLLIEIIVSNHFNNQYMCFCFSIDDHTAYP